MNPTVPRKTPSRRSARLAVAAASAFTAALAAPADGQLTDPFPAVFELEQLRARSGGDGSIGFTLVGDDPKCQAGRSVSAAGDVNGDGVDDIIVGAPGGQPTCPSCLTYPSRSYVVFGRPGGAGGFPADLHLIDLDGSDGFRLDGSIDGHDGAGLVVSRAGDFNDDGVDDLLVGAPMFKAGWPSFHFGGAAFVVFGRDTTSGAGFPAVVNLHTLDGVNGVRLVALSGTGTSVGAAGDVNGDGVDDVIVGAPLGAAVTGGHFAGQSFVVFGRRVFPAILDMETLDGSDGFSIEGAESGDQSGRAVASAGDINADGIADILIGVAKADPDPSSLSAPGRAYVIFGRDTRSGPGFPAVIDLAALDLPTGFMLDGVAGWDRCGSAVSAAGDVNADGIDDMIIGAPRSQAGGGLEAGQSYVVFGRDTSSGPGFPAIIELADLDGIIGFALTGAPDERSGAAVSGAGDLNGDGAADIIIGAPNESAPGQSSAGRSFVVFGSATGFPPAIDLTALDGAGGFRLEGAEPSDHSGTSVAAAGDVNDDGLPDIIIGAPGVNVTGKAYIIYGRMTSGGCYADCDESGDLGFFDFLCFQNRFAAGDPRADCDGSKELDIFDFLCFQNAFAAGCP